MATAQAAALRAALTAWEPDGARPTSSTPGLEAYLAHYGLSDVLAASGAAFRAGYLSMAGERIAVQRYVPLEPRAVLVLVHGLFDHAALWRHQIRWALEQQLAVCAFDLPGHGLSSGARAHVEDFAHYVDALRAVLEAVAAPLGLPIFAAGQSTGGAVLMEYLAGGHAARAVPLADVALLAPLVRPRAWGFGRVLLPLARPLLRSLPRAFYGNTRDPDFNRFQRDQDYLQPTALPVSWLGAMDRWLHGFSLHDRHGASPLVVQGTADRTVDWRHNLGVIRAKFEAPEILLLEGAEHNLMNEIESARTALEVALARRIDARLGGR
ncbi:MAG: alpha/beta hydrolase [Pseudomonadales bacterium]|jgi:alpha-beta hydrolase superfamily lysophospholipase|nr:alpha/beta hydrolase [Pseudomonadales bacterium]